MAIVPVSNVSFRNNYSQVNFEGKKKDKSSGLYVSNSIKAIPLATLIALSPLNGVQAQTNNAGSNEKVLTVQTYKNPALDGCNILYISNDGNDADVEAIALQYGQTTTYNADVDGQRTRLIKTVNTKQYLDTLKQVNVVYKYDDGKPERKYTKYVAAGSSTYNTYIDRADTKKQIRHSSGRMKHDEYEIDKELFEYLKQFMEDGEIKIENKVVNVSSEEDPFDLLF